MSTCQILKVHIEALTGFSYIHHLDGFNTHQYLKAMSLGQLLGAERASRMHISETGEGARGLQLQGSSSWVRQQARLLDDLPLQMRGYVPVLHKAWFGVDS